MRKIASSSERSRLKIGLVSFGLLAYPALIHGSVVHERPLLITGTWLVVSIIGLLVAARRGNRPLSLLFGILLIAGTGLWWFGDAMHVMYLPPVLVNFALMTIFWRTLLPGSTPLVGRVAALWRGTLDEEVACYTRRVTVAWTIFFAFMATESIALALFAPLHIWSLFTNGINYALVLLFFLIEYRVRMHCLPDHDHLSFREFCRLLLSTDLGRLAR